MVWLMDYVATCPSVHPTVCNTPVFCRNVYNRSVVYNNDCK